MIENVEKTLKGVQLPEGVGWIDADEHELLNLLGAEGGRGSRAGYVAYLWHPHPDPGRLYYKPITFGVVAVAPSPSPPWKQRLASLVGVAAKQFKRDVEAGTARNIPDVGEFEILEEDRIQP